MTGYRQWPEPARSTAVRVDAAVAAARAAEPAALDEALAALEPLDPEQVSVLLGEITRLLIEERYPDGLDADDARQLLESGIRFAVRWFPALSSDALIVALTGALGVSDPDTAPPLPRATVTAHGVLLIADLLVSGRRDLRPYLEAAMGELMRAQTMELP